MWRHSVSIRSERDGFESEKRSCAASVRPCQTRTSFRGMFVFRGASDLLRGGERDTEFSQERLAWNRPEGRSIGARVSRLQGGAVCCGGKLLHGGAAPEHAGSGYRPGR